jgi:sugar/nucleoside kinase (ribokinase family)
MIPDFPVSTAPLCVVGNLNRDVKVLGIADAAGILRDGETSVSRIVETIGGGGANSACAAAALGANVRFLGRVGDDPLADQLQAALTRHGVQAHLTRDARSPTGTTVALGFDTGSRHFLSCLPNNRSLTHEDLDLAALNGCGHLLRADVWFSDAMLELGNAKLLAEARRRGIMTSLDINFDPQWQSAAPSVVRRRKQLLRDVLPLVDLAHGNVAELSEFTDGSDLSSALQLLTTWGVNAVVVHLGAQGAGYYEAGELTVVPPDPAESPIHSTGTGDVLSMSMILLQGCKEMSVEDKLRISNRIVRAFMEGRLDLIPLL